MSRSFRSEKESVLAGRRIGRDADGQPILPRIVERRPAPGDEHPLSRDSLQALLQLVPIEYLYGLKQIELRARPLPDIGRPFGCYRVRERSIVLYSLPQVFHFRGMDRALVHSLQQFYAQIERHEHGYTVTWRAPEMIGLWFYCYVITHELGHHFVEQYKTKNSRIDSRKAEEAVADLHAERLKERLFAWWLAKQQAQKVAA